MGLFDSLFKKQEPAKYIYTPANENDACVALLVACMNADGDASDAEIDDFAKRMTFKTWFITDDIVPYYKKAIEALSYSGASELVNNACAMISEHRKLTIFAMCCDIFFSDGTFSSEEKQIAEYLVEKLGIPHSTAQNIMEVILIKNKDNRVFA